MTKIKKRILYIVLILWIVMGACIINDKYPDSIEGTWELVEGTFQCNYTEFNNCKIIIDKNYFGIYDEEQKKLANYHVDDKNIIIMNDREKEEHFTFCVNDEELRLMDEYGQLAIFIEK